MSSGRIPESPKEFDDYIETVDNHLNASEQGNPLKRGETLGMTAAEIAMVTQFKQKWSTGDINNPGYYDLHRNPDTRSKGTTANVKLLMRDFRDFFRPILTRISGSPNITPGDRLVLHIAEPVTSHQHPTARISDPIVVGVEPHGNGSLQISVRTREDSNRCSMAGGANAVEIAYAICEGKFKAGSEYAGKVRLRLDGPEDDTARIIRTTARFFIDVDTAFIGFVFTFYVRWINIHHPELAGPWGGPHSVMIT